MNVSEADIVTMCKDFLKTVPGLSPVTTTDTANILTYARSIIEPRSGKGILFVAGKLKDDRIAVATLPHITENTQFNCPLLFEELPPEYVTRADYSTEADPRHVYRGISIDELRYIFKTGHIRSDGAMNTKVQAKGVTFYATTEKMAQWYCGGTLRVPPSFRQPGFLLKVATDGIRFFTNSTPGELGTKAKIQLSKIVSITEIRLATARPQLYYFTQKLQVTGADPLQPALTFTERTWSPGEFDQLRKYVL